MPPASPMLVCSSCGYDLGGIDPAGACPECNTPVEQSRHGLLRFSSPDYLARVHRGVFLVVASIIAQIGGGLLLVGAGLVLAFASGTSPGGLAGGVEFLLYAGSFALSLAQLYGLWLMSEPDPAFTGRRDGSSARRFLRVSTAVQAAISVLPLVFVVLPGLVSAAAAPALLAVGALAGLASWAAWIVSYFAQMQYLRWLAPRIPNRWIHDRAKLLMWLGPVLVTVGALALFLGPLIALILYWNLLDAFRAEVKRLRREGPGLGFTPAPAP